MATVSDFKIRIDVEGQVEVNNLKKSLDDTQKSFDKVGSSANKASVETNKYNQVVGNLRGTLQGAITTGNGFTDSLLGSFSALGRVASGAALAVTAIVGLGTRAVRVSEQLTDVSKATGINASNLLTFKQSVIEAGGSVDDFATIAFKLNQSISDAAAGNEQVRRSFQRIGVAVFDASGKVRNTNDIFQDIINNFRSGRIGSEEMAAAIDLLGKTIAKLETGELQTINDPFKDKEIEQLDKYGAALERMGLNIDNFLVSKFGAAALKIEEFLKKYDDLEKKANQSGQTIRLPAIGGLTDIARSTILGPTISAAEQTAAELGFARPLTAEEAEKILYPNGRGPQSRKATGSTNKTPVIPGLPKLTEEQARSVELARNQTQYIRDSAAAQLKLLQGVNATIGASKVEADIAKAKLEIDTQTEQKRLALLKQINDIKDSNTEDKRVIDAKVNAINAEIESNRRLGEQQKKNREDEIRNAERLRQLQADINLANEKLTSQISIEYLKSQNDLIGLFGDELILKRGLLDIENERLQKIQQIAQEIDRLGVDATDADRERAQQRIITANEEAKSKEQILKDSIDRQNNLDLDWRTAVKQRMQELSDSISPAQLGIDLFGSALDSVGSALTNFVEQGKFSFKDFTRSLLRDMSLIIARALIMRAILSIFGFGGTMTPSTAVSSSFNAMPGMIPAAKGGTARTNQPYVVGELGPELFIPRSAGQIIPNHQLGMAGGQTQVTYNINAVDASSFRSLLARDPQYLFNVTEVGRRSSPARRLA